MQILKNVGGKMKIAICAEKEADRTQIRDLVMEYGITASIPVEPIVFMSAGQLCERMEEWKNISVVFLDISGEREIGLSAAGRIKKMYPQLHVILITACLNDALEGYKVKASGFLLKNDLHNTIKNCLHELLAEEKGHGIKLHFSFVEGEIELELSRIIYIETEGHRNVFHLAETQYHLYKKLDALEEELKAYGFMRIHRSFLVNLWYVERINSYMLDLSNGEELTVPKARYAYVKQEFARYKNV